MFGQGFTYSIAFQMVGQNSITGAIGALDRLDRGVITANRHIGGMGTAFDHAGRRGRAAFDGVKSSLGGFITNIGVGLGLLDSLKTAANVESVTNTITMLSDNSAEGGKNIAFLRSQADKLGIPLMSLMDGFSGLNGAMKELPDAKVRQMFEGFTTGARGMNLTADKTGRFFTAIQQMASKPFISAEEITTQISEAMPGSTGVMARAMGMGTAEFMNAVSKRMITPDKFLPAFAQQLSKEFGGVAATAADGANANFARLNNTFLDLKTTIGNDLLPAVMPFIKDYLIPGIKWIGENIRVVGMLTGAVWLLNIAMYANPLGLVVAALVAVAGAVIWAWNEFAEFRGIVMGVWEVLKPLANFIYSQLVDTFNTLSYWVQTVWADFKNLWNWFETKLDLGTGAKSWIYENLIDPLGVLDGIMKRFQTGYGEGLAIQPLLGSHRTDGVTGGALAAAFGGNNLSDYYNERDDRSLKGGKRPNGGGGGGSMTRGIEGITNGGSKNITINARFEPINIYPQTVGEGAEEAGKLVLRKMTQMLNSMNQAQ